MMIYNHFDFTIDCTYIISSLNNIPQLSASFEKIAYVDVSQFGQIQFQLWGR